MTSSAMSTRRRLVAVLIVVALILAGFVARLVDIQVVRAESLVADSLEKMGGSSTIYAPRGNIVDANGAVLASSIAQFEITTSPKDVKAFDRKDGKKTVKISTQQAIADIAGVLEVDPATLQAKIDDALAKNKDAAYALLAEKVSYDQFAKIRAMNIPWLYIRQTFGRVYPNGAVAGNIVGFVGADNQGQAGMELSAEQCLEGTDGRQQFQQSKDRVPLPGTTETVTEAKPGGTLQLTLDKDLNWTLQQLVASQVADTKAEYGIAMVTEVKTGKIRAIAEAPSVDPGNVDGTPAEFRGSRAFQVPFEPGSIFKPLTAAMLVDAGLADHNTQVVAPYRYHPKNGASIKDALPHEDERLTMSGVLQQSSNTGLSILGEKMPDDQRYEYLKKFGIGQSTDIKFPGQSSGVLHPVDKWDNQTKYVTMFGQGLSTTAVQMAQIYQGIANDGVMKPLELVEGCSYPDGTVTDAPAKTDGERILSASAAKETIGMMETVVTDGFLADQLRMPGYRVAAKSGTGEQFVDGQLQTTFVASMAGMFPADDPQYVVTVHLKSPLTYRSSAAAAPLFKEIVAQVIKKYGIPPSTTTPPGWKGTY
ncbi:cell division protein FtsI (penicillin-binding protein 3) [Mycetocola sp. BIGb0189]|uniref:peptidoglycan D,D-transpeptidase FtsI family protein n=1 Tax=Mycetocola sp. BIGb0189 TaxID=2940604 RepID=UPI0021684560|nr:penicillin-binding protein 2 [Mycetocola sp. BIGb0189]MCS4276945.1 cell division protein FtsI (penicillin-binding protein 3) [Mycetocola sp. BIGb0189]